MQGFFCQIVLEYYSLQARGTLVLPLVKFGNASNCNLDPNAFWTLNSCLNHCVPLDNKVKQTHNRPMSYVEHVAFFKNNSKLCKLFEQKKGKWLENVHKSSWFYSLCLYSYLIYTRSTFALLRRYCTCVDRACELSSLGRWIELNFAWYPPHSTACVCRGVIPEAAHHGVWDTHHELLSTVSRMSAGLACFVSQIFQGSAYTETLKD